MKHNLKLTVQVLASLSVMVFGTTQAVQAESIWLDFSVPDVAVKAEAVTPAASVTPPPPLVSAESRVPLPVAVVDSPVALEFGVPNADASPLVDRAGTPESSLLALTPPIPAQEPLAASPAH